VFAGAYGFLMALPPTVARELLTRRTITCEGHLRQDGLIDIEGHLVDIRGYDMNNGWRDPLPAGAAAHDMWARITIDDELTIVAAESVTDSAPYPTCGEVTPNTGRLVGVKVIGGFKRRLHELIGSTQDARISWRCSRQWRPWPFKRSPASGGPFRLTSSCRSSASEILRDRL